MKKTHEISINSSLFNSLATGARDFDIVSKNDKFETNDYVLYHQVDETVESSSDDVTNLFRVTSVNTLTGLQDGYVIIALKKID